MNDYLAERSLVPSTGGLSRNFDYNLDLGRVVQIIRKGWWIVAAGAFLGAVVAVWIVLRMEPTYSASAQVLLGVDNRADDGLGNIFQQLNLDSSDIAGEIAIMGSSPVLRKASERLRLIEHPEFNSELAEPAPEPGAIGAALGRLEELVKSLLGSGADAPAAAGPIEPAEDDQIGQAALKGRSELGTQAEAVGTLKAGLRITQVGNSNLVEIRYKSSDRRLAAAVPNAVAEAYLEEQLGRKFRSLQRVTDWLNSRMSSLRSRLEESERAVIAYRNTSLTEGYGTPERIEQQLRELSTRLAAASAQRVMLDSQLQETDSLLEARGVLAASGLFDSPLLASLRSDLTGLRQRDRDWTERFGEDSAQVADTRSEIERLEELLTTEVDRLHDDLDNRLAIAAAGEQALRDQLKELELLQLEASKRQVMMGQLQRELDANRVTYETFLSKFTQRSEVTDLQEASAQVVAYAEPPQSPVAPQKKVGVAMGMIGGMSFGLGLVFIGALINRTIGSLEQLRSLVGETTVLSLPKVGSSIRSIDPTSFVLNRPDSPLYEHVRGLRNHILLSAKSEVQIVALVSCGPNAGKTSTSVMLGRSIAQMGKSCLLIETDLRKGDLGRVVQVEKRPDLLDVLDGSVSLKEAVQKDPHSKQYILKAGNWMKDPAAVLLSKQMADLLKRAKDRFEIVILDTAPLLSVTDAVPLLRMADQTVLLVRQGRTTVHELERVTTRIKSAAGRISCVVLSMAKRDTEETYSY